MPSIVTTFLLGVAAGGFAKWVSDQWKEAVPPSVENEDASPPVEHVANSSESQANNKTLYYPSGQAKLDYLISTNFKKFPIVADSPQPPFYFPATRERRATHMAKDFHSLRDEEKVGYVLEFEVAADYIGQFPLVTADGEPEMEYRVPSTELADLNSHIAGTIRIVRKFSHGAEVAVPHELAG